MTAGMGGLLRLLGAWGLALTLALTLAQAATPACAADTKASSPRRYTLDPTHSFVTFEILHFDAATIRGRFGPAQGSVELDAASGSGAIDVQLDTASVSTGVPVLDALLKGAELLDAQAHPRAFFVARALQFGPEGGLQSARGEFTLRGTSLPLTLTATRFRCYFNPLFRREVCGGDFSAEIRRSDFGITHSLPFVADRVRLLIQVEAVRQP